MRGDLCDRAAFYDHCRGIGCNPRQEIIPGRTYPIVPKSDQGPGRTARQLSHGAGGNRPLDGETGGAGDRGGTLEGPAARHPHWPQGYLQHGRRPHDRPIPPCSRITSPPRTPPPSRCCARPVRSSSANSRPGSSRSVALRSTCHGRRHAILGTWRTIPAVRRPDRARPWRRVWRWQRWGRTPADRSEGPRPGAASPATSRPMAISAGAAFCRCPIRSITRGRCAGRRKIAR